MRIYEFGNSSPSFIYHLTYLDTTFLLHTHTSARPPAHTFTCTHNFIRIRFPLSFHQNISSIVFCDGVMRPLPPFPTNFLSIHNHILSKCVCVEKLNEWRLFICDTTDGSLLDFVKRLDAFGNRKSMADFLTHTHAHQSFSCREICQRLIKFPFNGTFVATDLKSAFLALCFSLK